MLASLQRKLLLGLALRALQTQDNLLGGLGLFTEDRLGLTTETLLLSVVTTLTLSVQRGLYFTQKSHGQRPIHFQDEGSPWYSLTFPALYWVTLCWVCLWQSLDLQNVRRVFGTLTWCARKEKNQPSDLVWKIDNCCRCSSMSLIVGENGWNRFDRNEIFNWRGNSEWCGCVQNVVVGCVSMLSINKIFVSSSPAAAP